MNRESSCGDLAAILSFAAGKKKTGC